MIAGPRREITQLIIQHRVDLLTYVKEIFQQGWPATDSEVATEAALANHIDRMAGELEGVLKRLRRRLLWAFREVQRLNKVREQQATLEQEDEAHFRRCDRLIKKLKGVQSKRRREAEGVDDINTYGVLAAEGYLPGYGLDTGSVVAMAEVLRLAKASDRVYMVAEWPQANAGHYQLELNWPRGSEQRVVTIAPKKISASWMSFSANESVTDSSSAGSSSVCETQAGEIALGECWAQGGCSAPSNAKHRKVHSCGPSLCCSLGPRQGFASFAEHQDLRLPHMGRDLNPSRNPIEGAGAKHQLRRLSFRIATRCACLERRCSWECNTLSSEDMSQSSVKSSSHITA